MVKNTFRDLIFDPALGGGIIDDRPIKAFIPGGVSAPWFGPELLDLPLGQDEVAEKGSMLGSGSIVVMDEHDLRRARGVAHHQVLLARVVRAVHAVSRGLGLARARPCTASSTAAVASRTSTCCSTCATTSRRGSTWPPQQTTICVLGPSIPSSIHSAITMFRDDFVAHVDARGVPA